MKLFVVIAEWDADSNRAYTLLMLDENKKAIDAETIYCGQISHSEMLRGWLSHVHDLKGDSEALIFTSHAIANTKPYHVSDYSGINIRYSAAYKRKYNVASYLAIEALKQAEERAE